MASEPRERVFHAYGAIAELFQIYDPRILVEGPANTGKTRGILEFLDKEAWRCPGIRILLARQTLQSLRESVMVTLEEKVWWPDHPAKNGTATRETRRIYRYPKGAVELIAPQPVSTTVVCGGMEDPGWTFSMEYDLIAVFEAWQLSKDSLESLYRANRNHVRCRFAHWNLKLAELVEFNWDDELWLKLHGGVKNGNIDTIPDPDVRARVREDAKLREAVLAAGCHQQIILDTNPRGKYHQLNRMAAPIGSQNIDLMRVGGAPSSRTFRSKDHPFTRVLSRHEDNPAATADDIAKLDRLTGARKANLRYGIWESEEGQIWEVFDPTVHSLAAKLKRDGEPEMQLPDQPKRVDMRPLRLEISPTSPMYPVLGPSVPIEWTFGAIDFGFRNAGCFGMFCVDRERRLYRACEIYFHEKMDDWWAEKIVELFLAFNLRAVVCDSEDPERIVKLNDRLSDAVKKRAGEPIARGVNKSVRAKGKSFVLTTIDIVRDLLDPTQPGGPKLFLLQDAHWFGRDERLVEDFKPASTEEEIPSYVWPKTEDGREIKETPDPSCADHGCDMLRYAALFAWPLLEQGNEWRTSPKFPIGSAGWRFQHESVLTNAERVASEDELERDALLQEMLERRRLGQGQEQDD